MYRALPLSDNVAVRHDGTIASKADLIRRLLRQNEYGTKEIAAIVQCSPRFVRMVKVRCRAAFDPRNWQVRLSVVEQKLRDYRWELDELTRLVNSQSRRS
jgi:hypothetical protein